MFQYHPPGWFAAFPAAPRESSVGGITVITRMCRRLPSGIVAELEYRTRGQTWTHTWTSYEISDPELTADLAAAGLALGRWLTGDRTWFTARTPGTRPPGPPMPCRKALA